jgi:phage terminase small subunit
MSALTFRQQRFVLEYLKDQNASAAAARAGYTAKNMASQGNELMRNPAIRECIRAELQDLLAEIGCSAVALMKQRVRAAFFRPGKMFSRGWEPLAVDELDEETRAAVEVKTVMRRTGPAVTVKQPDRDKALRALERVHERLERQNEQYYAQLEKEGKVPTSEEIEAMYGPGAEIPEEEISQQPQELSGSGLGDEAKHCGIPAKDQVFSGPAPEAPAVPAHAKHEIPQVMSGLPLNAWPRAAPGLALAA